MSKTPLLYDELNLVDKTYLANMSLHKGYEVLQKLMEAACQRATAKVIQLDPMTEGYEQKLASSQNTARAMNEFCADVLKSVSFHVANAVHETQQQEIEAELDSVQ